MAIIGKALIKGAELYFVKMDPKRPVLNYNETGFEWVVQVRTSDKKIAEEWSENFHINVKYDQVDKKTGKVWHGGNISRMAWKKDSPENKFDPPECLIVKDQVAQPLEPSTVGNGSIGTVKVQLRTWTDGKKKSGTTCDLLGILVTNLVEYTQIPDPEWDLSEGDTVVVPQEKEASTVEVDDEDAY